MVERPKQNGTEAQCCPHRISDQRSISQCTGYPVISNFAISNNEEKCDGSGRVVRRFATKIAASALTIVVKFRCARYVHGAKLGVALD
ncbi:hypothetical protein X777_00927 [Ooceraea biroi]|uniref:Uncharacterized protein n=1 Tax=Ooceraea biroi TaxID=2015173 RepID=A0A026WP80_OOCBI|nr:hypothetical protein X777_00927 [Ooceraea biroi]